VPEQPSWVRKADQDGVKGGTGQQRIGGTAAGYRMIAGLKAARVEQEHGRHRSRGAGQQGAGGRREREER
jgi:hypothetical protein